MGPLWSLKDIAVLVSGDLAGFNFENTIVKYKDLKVIHVQV